MANKSSHEYVCLNNKDKEFLEDNHLEDLLDTEGRSNAPLRTDNTRKSIERHLERQRLKQDIADFDLRDTDTDPYEEH